MIRDELLADVEEMSAIDGVPVPVDLNEVNFTSPSGLTGGTITGSSIYSSAVGVGGGSVLTSSGSGTSWISSVHKLTIKIPAGTRLRLDPDTGEYETIDDLTVEI